MWTGVIVGGCNGVGAVIVRKIRYKHADIEQTLNAVAAQVYFETKFNLLHVSQGFLAPTPPGRHSCFA